MMHRLAVLGVVSVSGLALAAVPGAADGLRVTVTDQPGAPGSMLQQLERLAGGPLGDLSLAVAVDTGGRPLTAGQIDALLAGREVDGVQVLGAMSGSQELLDTTIADLSDGHYDGPRDEGTSTATVMFASSLPDGREWCLTMCMASLKPLRECILERYGRIDWFSMNLPGATTLGGTRSAFAQTGGMSLGQLESVQTLVGDGEPSAEDLESLLAGREVDSFRRVAKVDGPDEDWNLEEVAENSGVVYAKDKLHLFTFGVPWLGRILAVCSTKDGGKTWKCTWQQWHGF